MHLKTNQNVMMHYFFKDKNIDIDVNSKKKKV